MDCCTEFSLGVGFGSTGDSDDLFITLSIDADDVSVPAPFRRFPAFTIAPAPKSIVVLAVSDTTSVDTFSISPVLCNTEPRIF